MTQEDKAINEFSDVPRVKDYSKMFENIPAISMKIFSWWKQNNS